MRWSSIFLSSLSRSFHRRLHPQSTLNGFEFAQHFFTTEILSSAKEGVLSKRMSPFIAFVLGGPGSGKGTQCTKIADAFGFTHLSAGDLLRKEILSNGENGAMILDTIKEGKIVPSEITVNLIRRAIETSENHKFLIDGFPRSDENRIAFERIGSLGAMIKLSPCDLKVMGSSRENSLLQKCRIRLRTIDLSGSTLPRTPHILEVGAEPDIVLFFDCPEEEMVKRVLSRNQGRIDDNIETVKKRLKVFHTLNLPIVNYYSGKGKVHKINAVGTVDEIFEKVRPLFAAFSNNGKD